MGKQNCAISTHCKDNKCLRKKRPFCILTEYLSKQLHLVHLTVKLFVLSWIKNERELIMPLKHGYIMITENVKFIDIKISIVSQKREGFLINAEARNKIKRKEILKFCMKAICILLKNHRRQAHSMNRLPLTVFLCFLCAFITALNTRAIYVPEV